MHRRSTLNRWLTHIAISSVIASAAFSSALPVAHASTPHAAALVPTTGVFLNVYASRDSLAPSGPRAGAAVTSYRWLLNLDNTGEEGGGKDSLYCHPSSNIRNGATPPAGGVLGTTYVVTPNGYPEGCYWTSISYANASPILSEGTQADWGSAPSHGLPLGGDAWKGRGLPTNCPTSLEQTHPCRFLVTVEANGYEIGGAHFQVPDVNANINVTVRLNPYPLPLGTVRLKAFDDTKPTDGTYDEATEKGLVGFHGLLFDVDGIVQADFFGNPLCTEYLTYQTTNSGQPGYTTNPALDGQVVLDAKGRPTKLPAHNPAPPDASGYYNPTVPGDCMSDTNGDITIPNMAPNHYSSDVTPPIGPQQSCTDLLKVVNADWECSANFLQTTTLEGNHDFDTWVMPNETGLDTELVVGGEPVPFVEFGFTHQQAPPSTWACPTGGVKGTTPGCGQITGQLYQASSYIPGIAGLPGVGGANGQSGMQLTNPIDRGWVTLNSLNTSSGDYDTMVATIPTQDPSRPGLQYPDCPTAPTRAVPNNAGTGCFELSNVPDGEYMLTIWDEPQEMALDTFNVSISNGQIINMGVLPLLGWFAHIYGKVCVDTNANGRCDPNEKGIPHQLVQNLNRTNNSMVGGINTSQTDNNGNYDFKEAYPLGLMSINQYFFTRYKTVGVTWQACNDPKEHTVVAPMVDVSYLPIISQCGRLDWAVVPYSPSANGDNGGIVATQREDYIRMKYNARQAQTNDYMTGIPGFSFNQYKPVVGYGPGGSDDITGYALNSDGSFCTTTGASSGLVYTDSTKAVPIGACGDYSAPMLSYISENNYKMQQCFPQDGAGNPIGYNQNGYDFMVSGGACVETTASGTQFGLGTDATPDQLTNGGYCLNQNDVQHNLVNPGYPPNTTLYPPPGCKPGDTFFGVHPVQTVDGNYTLGNIPGIVPAAQTGDVLVQDRVPLDTVLASGYCIGKSANVTGNNGIPYEPAAGNTCNAGDTLVNAQRPLFRFTTEEDVNTFTGAQFVPQGADTSGMQWPPAPGGGTTMPHQMQNNCTAPGTCGTPDGGYDENQHTISPGPDAVCAGVQHIVHVDPTNSDLGVNGGSPLENTIRHLCDTKLFNIQAGQSIAPDFHVHTIVDIPLPAHFWGYIVDDVSVETNRKSYNLGEVHGLPGVPIGIYDWTGRLNFTATSDYNGTWDVLMPSSDIFNCPTPAGICPNVYRFVGNDPGQPGAPNVNYDPNYRTIAANFEAWPNMLIPADNAPTRSVTGLEGPGVQFTSMSPCGLAQPEPQIFAIGPRPYTKASSANPDTLTIQGSNFGAGNGHVYYRAISGSTTVELPVVGGSWTDRQVKVRVGHLVGNNGGMQYGPGTITLTTAAGLTTASGVGFHVIGGNSNTPGSYNPHIVEVGQPFGTATTFAESQNKGFGGTSVFNPFPQISFAHLTQAITPGAVDHVMVALNNGQQNRTIGFGDTLVISDANGHTIDLAASHAEIAGEQGVVSAEPITVSHSPSEVDVDQSSTSRWNFPVGTNVTLIRNYAVQDAVDFAGYTWRDNAYPNGSPDNRRNQWLVVVYPKWDTTGTYNLAFSPLGSYYENVIIHSPLKLQGVGPGGIYNDGATVQGSVLDGRFWNSIGSGLTDIPQPPEVLDQAFVTPPEPATVHWTAIADYLNMVGLGLTPDTHGTVANPLNDRDGITGADMEMAVGAVVTEVSYTGIDPTNPTYAPAVDGLTITGGDQADFPGNISEVSGQKTTQFPEGGGNTNADATGAVEVQGGAVYVNGGTDHLRITNNMIRQNSSTYGAVRFGTLFQGDPQMTGGASHNYNPVISQNTFVADGGTNLAGALGIYDDTNGYSVDHNTFCMDASTEYGGAMSHYGYSPGGHISYNRMFLNSAVDEGGAITIASEPGYRIVNNGVTLDAFPDSTVFTQGTGDVTLDHNFISDNMAQDDGGALRIMGAAGAGQRICPPKADCPSQGGDTENEQPDRFQPVPTFKAPDLGHILLSDNVITNNVSGHEGGAISIADTPVIDIVNNTIAHNVTTATATTSDGQPSPGGIAVDINSAGLNGWLAKVDPYGNQIPSWMAQNTGTCAKATPCYWPNFSNAQILNDILWYNRAGSWGEGGVLGIGMPGDPSQLNFWDVGSSDAAVQLTVSYSLLGSVWNAPSQQFIDGGHNQMAGRDLPAIPANLGLCDNNPANPNPCATGNNNTPKFSAPYATVLSIVQQRTYYRFRPAAIVSIDLPPNLFSKTTYQLTTGSPAQSMGYNPFPRTVVPVDDILGALRPNPTTPVDVGAYQITPRPAGLAAPGGQF